MTYYVVDPSGAQYGPADLALLQQWQREGRILATTTLRDATTGQLLPASSVPGLIGSPLGAAGYGSGSSSLNPYSSGPYPASPYASGPYGSQTPYPSGTSFSSADMNVAWVAGILAVFCSLCVCAPVGIIFGIVGIIYARRAQQFGAHQAQTPLMLSYAGIVLGAIMFLLSFFVSLSMF